MGWAASARGSVYIWEDEPAPPPQIQAQQLHRYPLEGASLGALVLSRGQREQHFFLADVHLQSLRLRWPDRADTASAAGISGGPFPFGSAVGKKAGQLVAEEV